MLFKMCELNVGEEEPAVTSSAVMKVKGQS